jgi:hypothetical protein
MLVIKKEGGGARGKMGTKEEEEEKKATKPMWERPVRYQVSQDNNNQQSNVTGR